MNGNSLSVQLRVCRKWLVGVGSGRSPHGSGAKGSPRYSRRTAYRRSLRSWVRVLGVETESNILFMARRGRATGIVGGADGVTTGSPGVLILVARERKEIAARGEGFGGLGEGLSGNVPGGGTLVAG